ncbi:Cdc6/Cdc18 family protein [Haloarcula argentinensis]|uniref:ORC1-type DNA replication protein n=1 Tax=Haloarcula argentinensis TaxID=43776 RepID=A0ABU2F7F2_HALAR|nr:AAA family ATPase [Haloarcula argentinensis]MDS0255971.1 AAA family ATPase [Haloarcula argentinensis]
MTDFSSSSNIFEQEAVLREDYRPDELPERTDEMEDLHMSLAPAARGVGANNVFLHGKAGQGKTAAAKAKLAELQHHAENESDHLDLTTCYVSCESHDLSTTYKMASRIYVELTGESRPTGHATDVVMDMMFDAMNDIGGTVIIVLDEIDTIGDDDRILYSLPRARAQDYVEDHVFPSIIGISNDLQWRDNLSPKVKSSLYDDSVLFSPYDAEQLQQILRRRAVKAFRDTEFIPIEEVNADSHRDDNIVTIDNSDQEYLFKTGVLDTDVIPLIAALSAQDTGDARQAIKYLRKAGELADKNNDSTVTEYHVRQAQALVEREAVVEAMREMTTQAHLALAALTTLELSDDTPVRANPTYGVYQNIADIIGADKLGQRRFKDHLRELDMQGIADGKKATAGSIGGPAWEYQLQVNTEIAVEVIEDTPRLEELDLGTISPNRANR